MMDELSDGPEAEREALEAKNAAETAVEDMQVLLATKGGRRTFYAILVQFGAFAPVYTARQAGAHEAALLLVDRIKLAGMAYWHQMMQENEK